MGLDHVSGGRGGGAGRHKAASQGEKPGKINGWRQEEAGGASNWLRADDTARKGDGGEIPQRLSQWWRRLPLDGQRQKRTDAQQANERGRGPTISPERRGRAVWGGLGAAGVKLNPKNSCA